MATGAWPTMLDVANRTDRNGNVPDIAELLSQSNEALDDLPFIEANERTGHEFVFRTSIPAGSWIGYYQGTPYGKSTTAKSRVGIGTLRDYSQVDKLLAQDSGDQDGFRESEDVAFLEGMGQTIVETLVYGNTMVVPQQFMGLATFYNTINTNNAQNAANVINGGGTGSNNTSLWLVGLSPTKVTGLYPRGSRAGLEMEDKGDTTPGFDAVGNRFEALTSMFQQRIGFVPIDWRCVSRLGNVDVTAAGLQGPNAPDLFVLMDQMLLDFPKTSRSISGIDKTDAPRDSDTGTRLVFYCNRTLKHAMKVQSMRNRNVLMSVNDYDGKPIDSYCGVPIKNIDQILNTEAALT